MVPEFVERMRGSKWLSALPTGSKCVQAQPVHRSSCGVEALSFPHTKNLEALVYGRQIRLAGASKCVQAQPAFWTPF